MELYFNGREVNNIKYFKSVTHQIVNIILKIEEG
jgi:hypothetical protein